MKGDELTLEKALTRGPVIPVLVIDRVDDAVPLARALLAGGVQVLEVTLRTPVALDVIRTLVHEVPEALVAAGTVTTPEQWEAVAHAGGVVEAGQLAKNDCANSTILLNGGTLRARQDSGDYIVGVGVLAMVIAWLLARRMARRAPR